MFTYVYKCNRKGEKKVYKYHPSVQEINKTKSNTQVLKGK